MSEYLQQGMSYMDIIHSLMSPVSAYNIRSSYIPRYVESRHIFRLPGRQPSEPTHLSSPFSLESWQKCMWSKFLRRTPHFLHDLYNLIWQRASLADFQILLQLRQRASTDDHAITVFSLQYRVMQYPTQRNAVPCYAGLLGSGMDAICSIEQSILVVHSCV